jgi:hypothetical protein
MKVSLQHLFPLWKKYNTDFLQMTFLNDFSLQNKRFRSGHIIHLNDLEFMNAYNLDFADIRFDEKIYALLSTEYPAVFRKPYGVMDFIKMDRHLEVLQNINTLSKRKRYAVIVGEIYGTNPTTGARVVLATHNDSIDYKRWNDIKRFINKEQKFYYRNSECAILIFVNMTPDAETDYLERFKKNTDLVTSIVSRKKDTKTLIAPDFLPTEDVISVTDPGRLLEEYVRSNARLIIIGESLSESYKKALLQVKSYDKFVRMMVVQFVDQRAIDHFLLQVKLVYNSDRWSA